MALKLNLAASLTTTTTYLTLILFKPYFEEMFLFEPWLNKLIALKDL